MAVRDDFSAGEVLAAADLNDTFASKLPYSYGTATPTTSDDGFLWYDSNSTPPDVKFWDGAAFQALTTNKIVQVVNAVKSDTYSTTASTPTDITGFSATITPTSASNYLLITASMNGSMQDIAGASCAFLRLTDGTNTSDIGDASGSNTRTSATFPRNPSHVHTYNVVINWYYSPATTSAVTIKGQMHRDNAGTAYLNRGVATNNVAYPSAASTLTIMEVTP